MINIIGAGAIGSLWAAYCQLKQIPYQLYSRSAPDTRKLTLVTAGVRHGVRLELRPYQNFQPAGINLICVKAFALKNVTKLIGPNLMQGYPVLMMNGMGLGVEMTDTWATCPETERLNKTILQASFVQGAKFVDNELHHSGSGITSIGVVEGEITASRGCTIAQQLDAIISPLKWQQNQEAILWLKLLINAVINPLTALSGQANGSLIDDGGLIEEANTLFKEAWPVVAPHLHAMSQQQARQKIIEVASETAANHSSMLQDLKAGRQTEIDFINGFLLREANSNGLQLPLHQQLVAAIKGKNSE